MEETVMYKQERKNTQRKSVIKIIPFSRTPPPLVLYVVEGKLIFKLLKKLKNGGFGAGILQII